MRVQAELWRVSCRMQPGQLYEQVRPQVSFSSAVRACPRGGPYGPWTRLSDHLGPFFVLWKRGFSAQMLQVRNVFQQNTGFVSVEIGQTYCSSGPNLPRVRAELIPDMVLSRTTRSTEGYPRRPMITPQRERT